ncbi:MAG TPA: restriction endonuclease [Candidatus Baltobacteraceae bacterium]|jgi:hypothetical protein
MDLEKLDPPTQAMVLAYYTATAPLIAAAIGRVPFKPIYCPNGLGGDIVRGHTIEPFDIKKARWCLHRYAVAFESWTPIEGDPLRARLAHVLMRPIRDATETMVREAARTMRDALLRDRVQSIPVLNGTGITLWIPLAGGPPYANVRGWLHAVVARAMEAQSKLFSTRPVSESKGRIHVWVSSNATNQGCNLPYSLLISDDLLVVTPIAWDELETCANGQFRPDNFEQRLAGVGDRFAEALSAIGQQRLPKSKPAPEFFELRGYVTRGRWLIAAFEVLSDGRPRSAGDIYYEAVKRDLLPAGINKNNMDIQLRTYLRHMLADGRRPRVVQDLDHRWRANHPADDWPVLQPAPRPPLEPVLENLRKFQDGPSEAFEKAVVDVFGWMGFVATHLGGSGMPDGQLDAPLGPAHYRVLVECKSARKPSQTPDVWEASEHKTEYKADYCMLIYPELAGTTRGEQEAKTHGVSIWSIDNLETAAKRALDLWTMRALFEPGIVDDHLEELTWELEHGATRRIRTLADIIASEGWHAQYASASAVGDAPRLTVEAAMFLADARLQVAGSATAATRAEVEAAFAHLCDPLVNVARRLDGVDGAIVIVQ